MTESPPLSDHLHRLAAAKAEAGPDRASRRPYLVARREAEALVESHPERVAGVIEFRIRNNVGTDAERLEAIGLLYHLGRDHDHRDRAGGLLSLASQDASEEVRQAAGRAWRGLARMKPPRPEK